MFGAILLTLFPTLLFAVLLPKFGFKIKSYYLKIAFSWFAGMYITTICTFIYAIFLNFFSSNLLFKATIASLMLVVIITIYFFKDILRGTKTILSDIKSKKFFLLFDLLIILFCLGFSYFFFSSHLISKEGEIYRSPIYWDFHWHSALIQNFAYGDNFPPENEAFSGLTHTYHYFWGVITAMYEVVGLDLVTALNIVTILAFSFFLITIIGLCEEFFQSKVTGLIAVVLILTSSSSHFFDYFSEHQTQPLVETIRGIFTNTANPYGFSIVRKEAFTHNGGFFNLFYFLEERQMIFGVIYLLLSAWIIYKRRELSNSVLFISGALMGAAFLWHLYIAIMIWMALAVVLLVDKDRKKTFLLFAGFSLVFGLHYFYFKQVMHSEWFKPEVTHFPQINFGFSDQRGVPFSLQHAFFWYLYAYGLKLFLFPVSLLLLFIRNTRVAIVITAIILPTFIVLNTLQLSPNDIYENHKWLRPMNIIVDIALAFMLYKLFFEKVTLVLLPSMLVGIILLFYMTASGVLELMPFINSKPTVSFSHYPSELITAIREHTPPKVTIVGDDKDEIQLAGRKLFLGDTLGGDFLMDKGKRDKIITSLYEDRNTKTFCNTIHRYKIDYIELTESKRLSVLSSFSKKPGFNTKNNAHKDVIFFAAKEACTHKMK